MTKLQALAAQKRREALSAGLPCGEHIYTNKCEDQEAYRALEAMIPAEEARAKRNAKARARWEKSRAILLETGLDIGEFKERTK